MNYKEYVNQFAIIPSKIRYDNKLKPAEKLLYGELTVLVNKKGYCYAQNKYFSELYGVRQETVSRWISNLQKFNYIEIKIIRDENKKIISRKISIVDMKNDKYTIDKKINTPYGQKCQYPHKQKSQYTKKYSHLYTTKSIPPMDKKGHTPIYKKVKGNNIDDDIFYYIINNKSEIPKDFFEIVERLEFNYDKYMLKYMKQDKIDMIKDIVCVLYNLYKSGFDLLLKKVKRKELVDLYLLTAEKKPNNLLSYYKKAIINSVENCKKM